MLFLALVSGVQNLLRYGSLCVNMSNMSEATVEWRPNGSRPQGHKMHEHCGFLVSIVLFLFHLLNNLLTTPKSSTGSTSGGNVVEAEGTQWMPFQAVYMSRRDTECRLLTIT